MNIPSPSPAVLREPRGVDGNIHTNWLDKVAKRESQTRDGGRMISKSNFCRVSNFGRRPLCALSLCARPPRRRLSQDSHRARPAGRAPVHRPATAGARPRAPRGSPARILAIAYWALGRPPIAIRHCGPLRGCGPSRDPAARSDPRCRCRRLYVPCTPRPVSVRTP